MIRAIAWTILIFEGPFLIKMLSRLRNEKILRKQYVVPLRTQKEPAKLFQAEKTKYKK